MSSSIPERSNHSEVDTSFVKVIHQAAEQIGKSGGRTYLVINQGRLELSPMKGNLSFDDLVKFVTEKLTGLTAQDVPTLEEDLNKIGAEYLRQSKVYHLPTEPFIKTMEYLDPKERALNKTVSKTWNKEIAETNFDDRAIKALDRTIKAFIEQSFGPEKWQSLLNIDVGQVPPLPFKEIYSFLKSPSDFWPGKKTIQKSLIPVLIPSTANGKPFTWNMFVEMIEQLTKQGKAIRLDIPYKILTALSTADGNKPIKDPFWMVMTNDLIPESCFKSYPAQQALLVAKSGYVAPNLLPTAVSIVLHMMVTGGNALPGGLFTIVEELTAGYQQEGYETRLVVGNHTHTPSLAVVNGGYVNSNVGIVAQKNFIFNPKPDTGMENE